MSDVKFSVVYDDDGVTIQAFDPEDGPDSMPIFDHMMSEDEARDFEDALRAARLNHLGKRRWDVLARVVEPGDVIPDLGFRVSDILLDVEGKIVLQSDTGDEITLDPERAISVLRDI